MANKKKSLSLSTLSPAPGSRKVRTRVGRGESSGHGKTSGRGGKGQTARKSGQVRFGFEGGQMPLYRRVSKYGFRSQKKVFGTNKFHVINLSLLDRHFDAGSVVGPEELKALGFGRTARNQAGYKLLATGKLSKKLTIKVHAASAQAKAAVEAAGGSLELLVSAPVAQ
jgi:large subunit ribosomal protein L15